MYIHIWYISCSKLLIQICHTQIMWATILFYTCTRHINLHFKAGHYYDWFLKLLFFCFVFFKLWFKKSPNFSLSLAKKPASTRHLLKLWMLNSQPQKTSLQFRCHNSQENIPRRLLARLSQKILRTAVGSQWKELWLWEQAYYRWSMSVLPKPRLSGPMLSPWDQER